MKLRTLHWLLDHRVWLCSSLSLALWPSSRGLAAEPSWLAPSYQIVEIARAHYPHPYPAETYTDINPVPIGLGDNSQVVFHTTAPFGAAFGPRTWLWQPAAQFGRPAGTSLLSDDAYNPFYGTPPNLGGGAKGVTSDGRFGQLFPENQYERSLRWWNGSQWVTLLHETVNQTRFRVPAVIHDVNDRGDIAFEYRMVDNFGLGGWTNTSRSGIWSGTMQNWLPLFPEDATCAHVLAMNGNGVCVGVYRSATAPPGTAYRGFTATYGTTPMDFVPVGSLGGYSQTHDINDASEIVGVTGTQAGGVRPFIYLPAAAHGLGAGLHEIGPTMIGYTGSGGQSAANYGARFCEQSRPGPVNTGLVQHPGRHQWISLATRPAVAVEPARGHRRLHQ